jgi:hypothetical protein
MARKMSGEAAPILRRRAENGGWGLGAGLLNRVVRRMLCVVALCLLPCGHPPYPPILRRALPVLFLNRYPVSIGNPK